MTAHLDFIGDIHGQGVRLEALLHALGYRRRAGAWRHATRTAVFVGDLVDRGPEQLRTVDTVRRMVEAGSALCVMGNHEHNAIGWLTPHPTEAGAFCRSHADFHRKQHADFLNEVESSPNLHADLVGWMATLPVVLELGAVRVAHACWDERWVEVLRAGLTAQGRFTPDGLLASLSKGDRLYSATEIVTKGVEVRLPAGASFVDPLGKRRDALRVAWWRPERNFKDVALPFPGLQAEELPDAPVDEEQMPRLSPTHLHVFGHYWMSGQAAPLHPRMACLDYSGAPGRPLTAYRYDGEPEFLPTRYVQV